LVCLLLFALSGCQTVQTTAPGAIGVARKQHMLISEEAVETGASTALPLNLAKLESKED
jgi:hypothetical protein